MKNNSRAILPLLGVLAAVLLTFTIINNSRLTVKGRIVGKTDNGGALLDIMPQKLFEIVDVGDYVIVSVEDFEKEVLLTDELITQEGTYQLIYDSENHCLVMCVYGQHFYDSHGFSGNEKVIVIKK